MNPLIVALIIVALTIGLIILFFILKPYFIRHDTTVLFTGGLGSGKTLESVKLSIVQIRKWRLLKYYWPNFKRKIRNGFAYLHNKSVRRRKKGKEWLILPKVKKPLIYSNIPIHFRSHLFGRKKEWSTVLDIEHICLLKEINEYSVVFIDEFPQFISQFEWDLDLVQKNCNEFITFFRHYISGNLIITAQSEDEIECHFRRKLNQGVWCFDFHAWPCRLLPLFYTNRMCDFMLSDNITTMTTTYIEENTRIHFGLFPRKAYDTRCYKPRYQKVDIKILDTKKWYKLTTTKVLRIRPYISPLDDKTKIDAIQRMHREVEKLERNEL